MLHNHLLGTHVIELQQSIQDNLIILNSYDVVFKFELFFHIITKKKIALFTVYHKPI